MRPYELIDEEGAGPDIAVVGVAARLPEAWNVPEYWRNLAAARESVRRLSDEELRRAGVDEADLGDPAYVKAAAVLSGLELFDAQFFGFSPREASVLDPQHRHFLEVCWEALEDAGIVPDQFKGPIGVFGGSGMNAYMPYNLFTNPDLMRQMGLFLVRHTGNDKDFLTTRVSYCLNLRGPSVNVQTACSTSLVAIHLACQSLLSGECDAALAGGVTIELPHYRGYHYEEGEILSPDGHCRPFEANSRGTVFGSGAGAVVLRRLRDAIEEGDFIHAIIKGTAVNNDGSRKVGYLAPSVDGQADCIVEALGVAGLEARQISYIECHGTGTPVGDPIEVTALTQAFSRTTQERAFCGIGSVKSNIGHLDTAAGVASFVKVVEMLKHEQQVPTLHFAQPNPEIPFESTPFFVVGDSRPWPRTDTPRRAGISSLGVGGTNAHVIVEEAPRRLAPATSRREQVLVLSARSPASLDRAAERLASHLEAEPDTDLGEIASTLIHGRKKFPFCRVVAAKSAEEARQLLPKADGKRVFDVAATAAPLEVAFLFPGGGAQYANMSRSVYESEPVFKKRLDECFSVLEQRENLKLRELLFPAPGGEEAANQELLRPELALPALISIELSYVALLSSWGIKPVAALGHSLGEYAAAHVAGVISLEDVLKLVALRGRLFAKVKKSGMMSVPMAPDALSELLVGSLVIGVINGPELCVVSGENHELDQLAAVLAQRDIEAHRLHLNVAAHSPLLDPVLAEFEAGLRSVRYGEPTLPYLSNLKGTFLDAQTPLDAKYYVEQFRRTVRFSDCIAALTAAHPKAILLEVGPGQALSSLLRQHPARAAAQPVLSVSPHAKEKTSEELHLLSSVGRIWAHGGSVDWKACLGGERRIIPLPATPFEHERHWVEPGQGFFMAQKKRDHVEREGDLSRWFFAPAFRESKREPSNIQAGERWYVLVDAGPLSDAIKLELAARGISAVMISPGGSAAPSAAGHYVLPLAEPKAYDDLLQQIIASHGAPTRILHALCLSDGKALAREERIDRAFFSLMHLAQALSQEDYEHELELLVATCRAYAVADTRSEQPIQALAQGPVLVIPKEIPEIRARLFDLADVRDPEATARSLVNELSAPSAQAIVAERGRSRYSEVIERVALAESSGALPDAPVFLFTGGLGGISLTLARDVAAKHKARLVLVSRSGSPEESERAAGGVAAERVAALAALRELGVEVAVEKADISSPEEVTAMLRRARERFGRIDVVVHTAGVVDDGLLAMKSRAAARAVLAPKLDGADALIAGLKEQPPAVLVLISSTSAILGPPGQIDYVAANAYLNARCRSLDAELPGTRVLGLGFGVWRDTGMAARMHAQVPSNLHGEPTGHPLLGREQRLPDGTSEFRAIYRTSELWALDEHRVRAGSALLPGTAFVELIRAAGARVLGSTANDALELRDLTLLTALEVADDAEREVLIRASRDEDGEAGVFEIVVATRGAGDPNYVEHAQANVARSPRPAPAPLPAQDIRERCHVRHVEFEEGRQVLPQDRELSFGPRWKVIRDMRFGQGEAIARLELPQRFASDLADFKVHPGMLDMASGFAFSLADATGENDRVRVPLAYERVRVIAPFTQELVSYVRVRNHDPATGVAVFEVRIADPSGRVLLEADGYTTRSIAPSDFRRPGKSAAAPTLLERWIKNGITPEEGAGVFERVLASSVSGELYATPVSPYALAEDLKAKPKSAQQEASPASIRHAASTASNSPRDDVERQLAGMWQTLLGVESVGIDQNFFDVGGHSLIAVRLFSRIKKTYGVDLSLAVLFEAPTIEATARIIRDALGLTFKPDASPEASTPPAPADAPRAPVVSAGARFSPLVLIQNGQGSVPFFCVHGAGGNVLNFRDLARGLGPKQTFYGLQAQGVNGEPPLETIEAMAELYLGEVRRVHPRGPYLLGGYSGGGVVAYEMAQRLRRDGENVGLLAFLDTFRPGTKPRRLTMSDRFERLIQEGPRYIPMQAKYKVTRHLDELSRELKLRFFSKQGLPLPLELRDFHLTRSFLEASERYQPEVYLGPVTLFRARRIADVYKHVGVKLGWDDLTPNLSIVEVPGDHDSLVQQPNVQILTSHLKTELHKAGAPS
ncbi:MAG TPA: SDR family NAD(P)-dependent oxidoreductase [Polyangiaceae bacterium]